ncbi:MAG: CD3072 family TudS-related putative desulfidase [Bacillota bacterium]
MKRNKKIILLAHCILNCNSKVEGLADYQGGLMKVIAPLLEKGVGIIQLPCPELTNYGIKRWGHTKKQFDTPYFRKHCREILTPYLEQIKDYWANDYQILGVIGVDGSPSCGVNYTCFGQWGGEVLSSNKEELRDDLKQVKEAGVFIEELTKLLIEVGIELPLVAVDEENPEASLEKIKSILPSN